MLVVLRVVMRWVKSSTVEVVGLESRREEEIRDAEEAWASGVCERVRVTVVWGN